MFNTFGFPSMIKISFIFLITQRNVLCSINRQFRSRTWTSKSTQKWRQSVVPNPYIGKARRFFVALDIYVIALNLSYNFFLIRACSRGRVVEATELKSVGRFPRRSKSCRVRHEILLLVLFSC